MRYGLTVAAVALALTSLAGAVEAQSRQSAQGPQLSEHPKSSYYRGTAPQVRGYTQRRGGYSYNYTDGMIDYRDTSILRDQHTTRRQGGPFDNDFFFDSGINRHHSAPYHN